MFNKIMPKIAVMQKQLKSLEDFILLVDHRGRLLGKDKAYNENTYNKSIFLACLFKMQMFREKIDLDIFVHNLNSILTICHI